MLIGINGKINSGKSTVANILVETYGFKELSFADNLKQMCMYAFNLTHDQCYTQEGKEEKFKEPVFLSFFHIQKILTWAVEKNGFKISKEQADRIYYTQKCFDSPRQILQFVGTEICRDQITSSYHTDTVKNEINMYLKNYVISDVRFHNEMEFITEMGGKLVLIENPNQEVVETSKHQSEQDLPREAFDYIIVNDKTEGLESLKEQILKIGIL